MIQTDFNQILKLIETHKARLLTNLTDIKSTTPFQLDTVKTQFFYMLRDLDKIAKMGSVNEEEK